MPVTQDPIDLPLRTRLLIVALVALAHGLLVWSWAMLPNLSRPARHEMLVSVTLPAPPQPAPPEPKPEPPKPKPKPPKPEPPKPKPKPRPPEPKPEPVQEPRPVEQQPEPVPQAVMPDIPEEQPPAEETSSMPSLPAGDPHAPASPVQEPDREPDYQAAYLKNPVPSYPMVARRMGWQGKVVLSVEVLASGSPGQIKLHQSSGHDVLDKAAIKAVSNWRFVAARQGGQVVTKWFLVPIPFILKED